MGCKPTSLLYGLWLWYVETDCLATEQELKRLGEHKYSAVDNSWLDELCMKRWWEYVVTWCPMWMAPNLITLIGLITNLITVLSLATFSYSATEPLLVNRGYTLFSSSAGLFPILSYIFDHSERSVNCGRTEFQFSHCQYTTQAPSWAYALAALGLFFYQTLDAIDGKQARRTGSNSPLGELFDHGCDSMTQVFVTLNICYAMSLGRLPSGVLLVSIVSVVIFYAAHWSTYCTGQLRFSRFDVTEAQMTVIALLVATSILGNSFWDMNLAGGWKLRHAVLCLSLIISAYQIFGYVNVIIHGGVGKNGSTIAGTSVIFPLFPLLMVVVPFCMIYSRAETGVYDENITLFMLCFGAVGAKATNRLVIAHMSKSELRLWDWIYLGPLTLMLNQYYNTVFDELFLLRWVTVYCYVSLLIYCTVVCQQFCEHLNIYCFTLGARNSAKKST